MPTPSQPPKPQRDVPTTFEPGEYQFDDLTYRSVEPENGKAPQDRNSRAGAAFNLMSDDFELPPRQEWEIQTNFHNKYY